MRADLPLHLHPLRLLADGDEVVIGRVDVDSYAVFPADGAALVQRLVEGMTPAEAAAWYQREFGDTVDLVDLVTTLHELDFVATEPAGTPVTPDPTGTAPKLPWQRLGRAAFSWPAWAAYAATVVAAIALCVHDPGFLPHRDNAFFVHYLIVIEVTVALGQVPLILIHECFHVVAARRIGVPARIRVSHRLYFVVFETVMDGLVLAPRRRRYLPMLAGMLADVLVASLLTLGAGLVRELGAPALLGGLFLALALTTLVRLALEFLLFLRTDVYFLAATLGGCVDLHTTCQEMVRNWLWRLLRREDHHHVDPERWHPNDVRAARWYLPMYLLGYAVAIALLAIVLLPISWRFAHTAAVGVWHHDLGSAHFWDAAALLTLNGAQPAFAGLVALRERAQRRHDQRQLQQRRQTFLETTPADPHHPTDNRPTDHHPTDHHPTLETT